MPKRVKADPQSLNTELVNARSQYNSVVQSVIDRAEVRREQIGQVVADLKSEDGALAQVVAQARESQ